MGLIHVLDTEVSNKIAAGEVVERPASVVKEVIENSIDAGATTITIEIKGGGAVFLRITDNGCGMSAEDAQICFLRHATSKIQSGEDLDAIYTLGFRGEALSSIGAVAKVNMYTKRRQDNIGVCVTCIGGEIISFEDSGAPNGTVFEMHDLFYNTPARKKFLKKPASESGYISDIVSKYVLSYPEISFKLIRDGKEILFSPGDSKRSSAVYAVYGKDYVRNMLDVDYEYNGIRISGVTGKGNVARANRNGETFFVNKRYIKSPILMRAVEEAYKNQIMASKFPTVVLNIDIDASDVDINVHPTKLECKFSNEQDVYQAVYHAVRSALYELPNVPEIEHTEPQKKEELPLEQLYKQKVRESFKPSNEFKFKTEHRSEPIRQWQTKPDEKPIVKKREAGEMRAAMPIDEQLSINMPVNEIPIKTEEKPRSIPIQSNEPVSAEDEELRKARENLAKPVRELGITDFSNQLAMLEVSSKKGTPAKREIKMNDSGHEQRINNNPFEHGYFRVIGQLFDTYILIEKDNNLLLIDQHAAHERLNFEALKREIEESAIVSQIVLLPIEVKLTGSELACCSENKDILQKLGFDFDIENETVAISSVPGDVGWSEAESLFVELVTQLMDTRQNLIADAKERLIYTIACKASIKANMEISETEMQSLASKVFALENINTCPHGRPIVISMSKKEIEKNFKRIV